MLQTNTLKNGVTVVTFQNDNAYSATVGVWARVGAVDEDERTAGISHFIEHMLFKGTKTRTAKDIAFEMDSVGGQLNAFTSKECTCYHATVTYEHTGKAVKLLADMLKNSLIDSSELDKERGVILEEISMTEDTPDDVVHEIHGENFFSGTPLSHSVIGSKETVSALQSEDLKNYMKRQYAGNRIVVCVAGKFDNAELQKLIEEEFLEFQAGDASGRSYESGKILRSEPIAVRHMPVEQVHICLGFPGLKMTDENLYNLYIFNNLFGGNMSSRLFQTIREENALCYTVYSFAQAYLTGGTFTIYSATNKDQVKQLIDLTKSEINKILKEGPTKEEITMAKEQMKGSYLLGIESTNGRMHALGRSALLTGKAKTPEEVMGRIDAVDYDIMMDIIKDSLDIEKMTASFVGDVSREECNEFLS